MKILFKPSLKELIEAGALFPAEDPRRGQLLTLIAKDDETFSQLLSLIQADNP